MFLNTMAPEAAAESFGNWSNSSKATNILGLLSLLAIYYVYTVVYGLYFGPLSHIPCRKLAGQSLATYFIPDSMGVSLLSSRTIIFITSRRRI
jgi:hypothetical protein